jgi:hypothetical protein
MNPQLTATRVRMPCATRACAQESAGACAGTKRESVQRQRAGSNIRSLPAKRAEASTAGSA